MKNSKQSNLSVEKFIWESSIPDSIRKLGVFRSDKSQLAYNSTNRNIRTQNHSFLKKKKSFVKTGESDKEERSTSPFYSIKYLGVTKGSIGILSRRAPIPQLSPLETCKDVPLVVINSSLSENKSMKKFGSGTSYSPGKWLTRTYERFDNEIREHSTNKEVNEDYVIHTYARPRGLTSLHKNVLKDNSLDAKKPIAISYNRPGVSGWKLTRPKTSSPQKLRKIKKNLNDDYEDLHVDCKHIKISEGYSEPYIKFLVSSRKSRKTQKKKQEKIKK